MKPSLQTHLETIGPRALDRVAFDVEMAGWDAAVNIQDYMNWCVEGYAAKLNIYGEPYLTEADNDKELTEQVSELREHVVAINGLRTVRFMRPSLKDIVHKSEFPVGSWEHTKYIERFYDMLTSWHHRKMDGADITSLLQHMPPSIEVLMYQAPDGTRTGISSDGFIGEGQDPTPSRARPFGQRGGGRIERPHKDYSYTPEMVRRVSKQIVHLVTHQDRFRFDVSGSGGYVPDWVWTSVESEDKRLDTAWEGWKDQTWFD